MHLATALGDGHEVVETLARNPGTSLEAHRSDGMAPLQLAAMQGDQTVFDAGHDMLLLDLSLSLYIYTVYSIYIYIYYTYIIFNLFNLPAKDFSLPSEWSYNVHESFFLDNGIKQIHEIKHFLGKTRTVEMLLRAKAQSGNLNKIRGLD